jgi:hypothetical protein
MEPPVPPVLFSILFFVGMLIMLETGRRLAVRRRSKEVDRERSNLGTIEGAVFALFGLMMAFTFSGAASRFNETHVDRRRGKCHRKRAFAPALGS